LPDRDGWAAESAAAAPSALPRPAHVVVVIEENKSGFQIDRDAHAPYLNRLLHEGAYFTNSHGVTHPSLPNYLALFAGLTTRTRTAARPSVFPAAHPIWRRNCTRRD